MNGTLDCEEAQVSLGVYVLGAIGPAERTAVDAHLSGCAECRAELADIDGLPALLGTVSTQDAARLTELDSAVPPALPAGPDRSAPDPASLSAARNRRNRRGRLRIAAASAAAAVLVALAGLFGALLGSRQVPPGQAPSPGAALGPWHTATGTGAAGMHATVQFRAMSWGTQVAVQVTGIPVDTPCSIEAIGPNGTAASTAGSWVTDRHEGKVWYTAGTALSGNRLSRFVITVPGHPAITIHIP